MSKLTDKIASKAIEYGSVPFWSWNDKLDPDELRRQIRNMHELEMRGFFMHARGGLATEYMSDEWFECVDACIDEAKKLGMEAWAYDENGWPSGFAGGKVLEDPDNHAVFVEGRLTDSFPKPAENILAVYARDAEGVPSITDKPIEGCNAYLTVTVGTDSSYVDTMRPEVIEQFIAATHEVYKSRVGKDFGGVMPGFFTDEPQYYRAKTPYSKKMAEWFFDEYGYSVLDALPSLFIDYKGAETYRYDYHRLTNKKFTEGFSKTLYDWAEANGVQITGHYVEEGSLEGQMMCCGDIMPQYQYMHIPGIDYLGRRVRNYVMGKQLGSVCEQLGKKQAMSEMFACCGWDVTPRELKHIAEIQYSGGVNFMCQHLYPYSIRGQRKRDYPTFYSEHNLWQSDLRELVHYFNNLGCILGMGKELADTLVIHPMRSAWLTYQRTPIEKVESSVNRDFEELLRSLAGNFITFHLGSEAMMDTMASVEGDKVRLGLCEYKQIIVPACDTLNSNTVELLKKLIENGGKVYTYKHRLPGRIDGRVADLSFLAACEDVSDTDVFERFRNEQTVRLSPCGAEPQNLDSVRMEIRNTEFGRLIYVTNLTGNDLPDFEISVDDCKALGKLDIATLDVSAINGRREGERVDARFSLKGSESVVLYEYDAPEFLPYESPKHPEVIKLDEPFKAEPIAENMMTLDRARVTLDGSEPSELRPLERIRDELLSTKYRGRITLSFPFEVRDIPEKLRVVTEPYCGDSITVNGNTVKVSDESVIDRSFRITDIAPYCKTGENTVDVTLDYYQRDYVHYVLYGGVSETLRNCLVFDTEIENLYLMGSFALDMKKEDFTEADNMAFVYDTAKGMTVISQRDGVDISNIVTDGYPFYSGKVTASARYTYRKGDPTMLHLTGRYSTAHVSVNGEDAGSLVLSEYLDLDGHLKEGENTVTVTLCSSYRNLFGPHHREPAEPLAVSPRTFSFENMWKNGECPDYRSRYAFVRFGIDQ